MSALTKILIVLQLVFAVAVSVLLVLMISRQENYKSLAATSSANYLGQSALLTDSKAKEAAAREQIAKANAARETAEQALAKATSDASTAGSQAQQQILTLQSDKRQLEAQVAALTAGNSTAMQSISAKDKELETLRPEQIKATSEKNELAKRNNELESQVRALELGIRKLQEQLIAQAPAAGASTNNPGTSGSVQMMSSAAPAANAAVNAKITNVQQTSGRTMVELPLGSRDGITENTPLFIYRSSGYVADAVVQRVTPTASVAVVTKTREGQTVQAGDTISTIGR